MKARKAFLIYHLQLIVLILYLCTNKGGGSRRSLLAFFRKQRCCNRVYIKGFKFTEKQVMKPSSETPTVCGWPGSPWITIAPPPCFSCSSSLWFSSRNSRISFSVGLSLTTALVLMALARSAKRENVELSV